MRAFMSRGTSAFKYRLQRFTSMQKASTWMFEEVGLWEWLKFASCGLTWQTWDARSSAACCTATTLFTALAGRNSDAAPSLLDFEPAMLMQHNASGIPVGLVCFFIPLVVLVFVTLVFRHACETLGIWFARTHHSSQPSTWFVALLPHPWCNRVLPVAFSSR